MARVSTYSRPTSVGEAIALLERPGATLVGGGTSLNDLPSPEPVDVVDLQALALGGIEAAGGGGLRVGAGVTLDALARDPRVPVAVRESARRERPSTLRAQSTLGGRVAAGEPESELLAVLLVHDAVVTIAGRDGDLQLALEEVLASLPLPRGRIVTAVTLEVSGRTSTARTARTPADRAIVSAAARAGGDGRIRSALSGVAGRPVLVEGTDGLDPPGDFRGTGEYRRALAGILLSRVLAEVSS